MASIGQLRIGQPIEKAMRMIKEWLDKIRINGLSLDIRYDARQNVALVRFSFNGKNYEFKSASQSNCRLNMWAIARVMEYKVRAHLMGIEKFDKSMQAYLQLEASPEAMQAGNSQSYGSQDNAAYATLGVSPLSSNTELIGHFRKLSKSWHPDMAGSEEAKIVFEKKFSEINSAWETIKKERMI